MPTTVVADENLIARLPLPLAQLYRRAHNAKNPLERQLTAYYLWEATLKLLGAVCIIEYVDVGEPELELVECLHNLARPALGHWWEFIRRLLPVLAEHRPAEFLTLRDSVLGKARDDFPRAAGLDAALRQVLDANAGPRATVYLAELFERLVRYRNKEIGHGAAGRRPADFYERMGASLLLAAGEVLGRLDILAGRRLLFLSDIRQVQGQWLIERFELIGEAARRLESWSLPRETPLKVPEAGLVYLARPPVESVSDLVRLYPLMTYDAETTACSLLNARRGKVNTEYLCYTTGLTSVRTHQGSEQRTLLAHALGMAVVSEDEVQSWAAGSSAEEGPEPAAVTGPRRLGEYELLSELGRGGMGIVYRAWQPSLGRQVALKCLAQPGDPKAEARFRREIRALGRVEHPHLVQVFASGSDGEQWFYVMELVEGVPLSAVCDQLATRVGSVTEVDVPTWQTALEKACAEARAQEKPLSDHNTAADLPPAHASEVEATTTLRGRKDYVARVVALVRQVAEAAHALHERGILHRDIKPGNILVAPDGTQATLMDLGLAQLADDVEGRLTRTRQFVGTLRYASPQQVLAVSHLDRRSDVYSLGATLWELLALQPLFGATEQTPTPELMEKIQREEPARLRRLHPGLSRNLEAVVHKCLEKSAERRYATAHDLAEDLRRVQEGEPVKARPVGRVDRALKWTRRHPAQAAALALLWCTAASLAAGFVLVNQERGRTAQANADLSAANTNLVQVNGRLAEQKTRTRQALDAMTSEVMDDLLSRQQALTPQQKKFLENALGYYLAFAKETGDDEQTRAGVAAAYDRVANIRRRLGLTAGAAEAYRHSKQWYGRLSADFPSKAQYRSDLAGSQSNLGGLLVETGHHREAEQQLQAALTVQQQLVADFPTVADYRRDLAGSHHNLGSLYSGIGRRREAEMEYRTAQAIQKELCARFPASAGYRSGLANSHNNLGNLLADTGRPQQAEQEYRAAVAIEKRLAADFPLVAVHRSDLAQSHNNLSNLLRRTGRHREADAEGRAALAIYQQLAADFPTVPGHRAHLASSHVNLGILLRELGHPREAEEEYRAALTLRKRLAADFPTIPSYRSDLAAVCTNLGGLLSETGRSREAEVQWRASQAILKQLALEYPNVPEYRRNLASSHNNLGALLSDRGQWHEAEAEWQAALAIRKQLAADFRTVPAYRSELADSHVNLGLRLRSAGKIHPAEEQYGAAMAIYKQLVADFPTIATYRVDLAQTDLKLGNLLFETGEWRGAEQPYRTALAIYQQLVTDYPTVPEHRKDLASGHQNLGMMLFATGHPREAEKEARAAIAIYRQLAADFPTMPGYRSHHASSHSNLGVLLLRTGRPREGEKELQTALAICKQLVADFPAIPDHQNMLAGMLVNLAAISRAQNDLKGARRLLEQALPHHRAALKTSPHDPTYRNFYHNNLDALAPLLASLGAHAEAARAADELAELGVVRQDELYDAACVLSLCAPLALQDAKLPAAQRSKLARQYADRAMAALQKAVAAGYRDGKHMQEDHDLDPLRRRVDFKKLLAGLKATPPTKQPAHRAGK